MPSLLKAGGILYIKIIPAQAGKKREEAHEIFAMLMEHPYYENGEGSGPFYYFPPYSQYIKYDFADFY